MSNANPYLTHHDLQVRWGGLTAKYILEFANPTLVYGTVTIRLGYSNKRYALKDARMYRRGGLNCKVYDFYFPRVPIG